MKKTDIFGMTVAELQDALSPFEIPAYRAKQMAKWMYQAGGQDFSKMTNLPKDLPGKACRKICDWYAETQASAGLEGR